MNETSEQMTRVSVVMCTYNGRRFLREQMDSILAQDLKPYEIIVQDDLSTDDTWDLLETYQRDYPGLVKIHRNAERLGFNRNFHTAMLRATGDYIAISDQDDIWFPQKLRRQVEAIGTADCCVSEYYTDPTYERPLHHRVTPKLTFEHILFYDPTPGHVMLLRTSFVKNIPEWNYRIYYDWWLAVHALMGRGIALAREPLNWHRHYVGSATTQVFRKGFFEPVEHPTWQPYVVGLLNRYRLQRNVQWKAFYSYLASHIDCNAHPLAATIARLQTRRCPFALLRLCMICARHYKLVYPRNPEGWKGRLHGFFYPMISAYGNALFKL